MSLFKTYTTILLFSLLSISGNAQTWEGNGTNGNPFLIQDIKQLEELADSVNNGNRYEDTYFEQTTDIDISESQSRHSDWAPIGSLKKEFAGIYNGQNHYIRNAKFSSNENYIGIFGHIGRNGSIKNLNISKSNGYCNLWMGGVCALNEGLILNCHTYEGTISCYKIIGGIVGANFGIVEQSSNNFYIMSSVATGGIVGYNYGEIINCYNNRNFDGALGTGGITGYNGGFNQNTYCYDDIRLGYIQNCYNLQNISGESFTGGICGRNDGFVLNCHNSGQIEGEINTGGIAGINGNKNNVDSYILNSYNMGDIYSSELLAGGIAGSNKQNGHIQNVYNASIVKIDTNNVNSNIVYLNEGEISHNYWLNSSNNNIEKDSGLTSISFCFLQNGVICNDSINESIELFEILNHWVDTTSIENVSKWGKHTINNQSYSSFINNQDQDTKTQKVSAKKEEQINIYTENGTTHIYTINAQYIIIYNILGVLIYKKETNIQEKVSINLPSNIYFINNQKHIVP